ncbi:MAG: chemotaxis protein CheB [Chloroflexi bacterium]|nr:MAG: chemotaxis protein CheB [Chloroflexota bacterium]
MGKVPKTTAFDIVAIAASAGGVTALARLLSELPKLGAIVVIVQHVDPRHRSLMPQVIGRRSPLPVEHVEDETQLAPDHVYLAPPDHHLLVNRKGRATLTDTELVNFVRPSADLLFESVAAAYGDRAIAVVLTGSGRDGAMGVTAIKQRRGTVIAQDEQSSEFFGMPSAAIATGAVDFILPLDAIAPKLVTLMRGRDGE